jgi:hypothetical protein
MRWESLRFDPPEDSSAMSMEKTQPIGELHLLVESFQPSTCSFGTRPALAATMRSEVHQSSEAADANRR